LSIREDQLDSLERLGESPLTEADLLQALDTNREQIEVLEARAEQLEQALVKARREQHLLESLLALRRGENLRTSEGTASAPRSAKGAKSKSSTSNGLADAAVSVLEGAARPMHIGELMSALVSEGVEIPGAGSQANLIAHLRREQRIARPSRGMYGLRVLGVEEYQPKKRTGRRKRSRSTGKKRTRS
jgi:hypothetical protein